MWVNFRPNGSFNLGIARQTGDTCASQYREGNFSMRAMPLRFAAVLLFLPSVLHAQAPAPDISGNWQGTLVAGQGLRTLIKISKADTGGYKALFYSIDQTANP